MTDVPKEETSPKVFNQKFLTTILTRLKRNANAGPFLQPVDPIALGIPDYTEKIKNPMDLQTIKEKLDGKAYESNDDFLQDMRLMFNNCYLYNGEGSPVGQMGKELEKAFDKMYLTTKETTAQAPTAAPVSTEKPKRNITKQTAVMPSEDHDTASLILSELEKPKHKKVTWPFMQPVTDTEAPGYSIIVKKPIDLGSIRFKMDSKLYTNLTGFVEDLQLITDNCKLYNPENSEIFKMGVEFEKLFKKELSKREAGPDAEIEELRKKISDLMLRLNSLEEAKRLENSSSVFYSVEDREKVGSSILALGREESDRVVEIIQRSCSSFSYVGNDEIEVNMLTLPDHVIGEIREFMTKLNNKVQESSE